MRKIRLTKEEMAVEESLDKYVLVSGKESKEVAEAIAARKKDTTLTICSTAATLTGSRKWRPERDRICPK